MKKTEKELIDSLAQRAIKVLSDRDCHSRAELIERISRNQRESIYAPLSLEKLGHFCDSEDVVIACHRETVYYKLTKRPNKITLSSATSRITEILSDGCYHSQDEIMRDIIGEYY